MQEPEPSTKERILAAAEAVFLAHGYDRSRMQAIADEAGINKALLHYYFGNKEALFAEIFRQKTERLFPRAEASLRESPDFIAFCCAFVDLYFSHLIANPFLPFYVLQVSTNHLDLFTQVSNDFPKKFVRAFEAAVRGKTIRPHDPHQFLISVLGMCLMPFIGKNLIQHVLDLDERAFAALLQSRADELKRYLVLLLTPEAGAKTAKTAKTAKAAKSAKTAKTARSAKKARSVKSVRSTRKER